MPSILHIRVRTVVFLELEAILHFSALIKRLLAKHHFLIISSCSWSYASLNFQIIRKEKSSRIYRRERLKVPNIDRCSLLCKKLVLKSLAEVCFPLESVSNQNKPVSWFNEIMNTLLWVVSWRLQMISFFSSYLDP